MRLEAIEKEANLYSGKGECYIHIERAANSPIAVVATGDPAAITQAVYNLMCQLADDMGKTLPELLKLFKRAYKQFGTPERKEMQT